MRLAGNSDEDVELVWKEQHAGAATAMWEMCIKLRGFYLKSGQFIGSRGDFVPEPICRKLSLLCDKVPPMPAEQVREIISQELGIKDLAEVFEWIDLQSPLGSASISQVHKAKLRRFTKREVAASKANRASTRASSHLTVHHVLGGEKAWDLCNSYGVSMRTLRDLNRGVSLEEIKQGQALHVPATPNVEAAGVSAHLSTARLAVMRATASGEAPKDGLVAIKVHLDIITILPTSSYL